MMVSFSVSFLLPQTRAGAREQLSPSMGCVQGSRKLERSGFDNKFCDFIFRQPQAAGEHSSSTELPGQRDEAREFQI